MLFRPALLEGEAEERLSAGFGCRQPAAAPLSAAGPVPESGASSQKRQAAGRQNAAFGQILGLSRRGALSHRLRDRPAVRAARKNRSARQPERCADRPKTPPRAGASHFYPRSPRGERHISCRVASIMYNNFYPRSPQGERQRTFPSLPISPLFLSTLPAKGSDPSATGAAPGWPYFYPHSPQGERRQNPTNIKDGFCVKVPNKNLKYTKQNAILCIQHNFNID